jgi:phosphate-selective porin OprO/OprP
MSSGTSNLTLPSGRSIRVRACSIHRFPLIAVTLGLSATSVVAEEPSREELAKQIAELKAKVEQLEATQQKQTEKLSKEEVDATVQRVLSDADRHSQLLQAQGFTAGFTGGKFIIQSEDGNFVLNPQLWFQPRYVVNYREEDAANEVDGRAKTEEGFEVRRMKLLFEGNAFTKDLRYKVQFNTNRNNGNLFLEEAFVSWKFAQAWGVRLGQFKEATFHEELMSDVRQLAAERSLVNQTLGGGNFDRVQGITLFYDPGADRNYRAEAGITDGPNTKNTNFQKGGGAPFYGLANPDFGLYARSEYKFFGNWKNYDDFTAVDNTQDLLVLGGGASYNQAGDNYALFHTVDAQYETGPLGIYGAYLGVYSEQGSSIYDFGFLAQAAYLVTKKIEPFVRYEYMNVDTSHSGVGDDNFHVFTGGVNYYIRAHALKLTLDMSWLPNGSPINFDGGGILDPDSNTDQFVVRGQFQLIL